MGILERGFLNRVTWVQILALLLISLLHTSCMTLGRFLTSLSLQYPSVKWQQNQYLFHTALSEELMEIIHAKHLAWVHT